MTIEFYKTTVPTSLVLKEIFGGKHYKKVKINYAFILTSEILKSDTFSEDEKKKFAIFITTPESYFEDGNLALYPAPIEKYFVSKILAKRLKEKNKYIAKDKEGRNFWFRLESDFDQTYYD